MRRLTIIGALALALSLAACGGENPGSPGASGTPGPDRTDVAGSTSPLETGATAGAGGPNNGGTNTTGQNPGGQGATVGPSGNDAQAGGPNATAGAGGMRPTAGAGGNSGITSACDELQAPLAQALGAELQVSEAALSDPVGGGNAAGCQLIASGTGEQFESHTAVAQQIDALLTGRGWAVDNQYAADSPTSTAKGYRSGELLALATSGWQPAPDISCPADQPISSCDVPPAKRMFTIVVNIAPVGAGAQATPGS